MDRGALRYLAQKIVAELRAGQGDGYRGIARHLNLANRQKGSSVTGPHDPLARLVPFIEEVNRSLFSEIGNNPNRQVVIEATVRLAIRRLNILREETEALHLNTCRYASPYRAVKSDHLTE